jgi:hypothetical protein
MSLAAAVATAMSKDMPSDLGVTDDQDADSRGGLDCGGLCEDLVEITGAGACGAHGQTGGDYRNE